ncbi:unnamed protein product [Strongylus vulgaris]|uniref:B box-type domain-containing protein n=1 Tax=Strongylus vulgaris TaxID=40348 RepID=A0A3P7J4M1_STRVU|nr:unnamed protein product [Strongylus vulgaris]
MSFRHLFSKFKFYPIIDSFTKYAITNAQQPSSSVRPATPLGPPAHYPQILSSSPLSPHCSSSGASDTISVCISDPDHDSDKMSVLSEADSGVVCSRSEELSLFISFSKFSEKICKIFSASRPSSIVGPPIPRIPSILTPSTTSRPSSIVGPPIPRIPSILTPSTSGVIISCGVCQKPSYYADEVAISNAPTNMAIQNLCEENIKPATVYCEQCDIYYCQPCQVALHPARGPLAKHSLVSASQRQVFLKLFS